MTLSGDPRNKCGQHNFFYTRPEAVVVGEDGEATSYVTYNIICIKQFGDKLDKLRHGNKP